MYRFIYHCKKGILNSDAKKVKSLILEKNLSKYVPNFSYILLKISTFIEVKNDV